MVGRALLSARWLATYSLLFVPRERRCGLALYYHLLPPQRYHHTCRAAGSWCSVTPASACCRYDAITIRANRSVLLTWAFNQQ